MREYELNFIVQPEISEEGSADLLARLDAALEPTAGRLCCDDLGKRKLAYEISRFQKGHYYLLSFLDDGQLVPQLERMLGLDESVLRFLTVKVSDQVPDVEARKAEAREREAELKRRAVERAEREAEEARAREEAEEARAKAEAEERRAAEELAQQNAVIPDGEAGESSAGDESAVAGAAEESAEGTEAGVTQDASPAEPEPDKGEGSAEAGDEEERA